MSTGIQNLNLARKWRPQSFDTIIGQDIAVRMLKNSLYLNKYFPVYLFAGQRGCGKTSTARIFAAAVNCANLGTFQKNPSQSIPCLTCDSCIAMIRGDHPDFIEIDAASHTGVDNVRQIIEASSYMPLVGQKKLYLIDEAHMLSKAAFNAFLKILEEPPMTVLFILATTEVPKIPTTVLSRCFQLIFNPIESISLKRHLYNICSHEEVTIDEAALDIILDETEGSARDAINLLERVRFSNDTITEQTVLAVLGKISIKDLFTLFEHIIDQQATSLLQHLSTIQFEQRSPQFLWDMIVQLGRALLWVKYGLQNVPGPMGKHIQELQQLAQKCSLNRLNAILNFLWSHEELFLRTNKKHLFLEMVLLQLCQQVDVADLEDLIKAVHQSKDHGQQTPPVTAPTKLSQAMPHQEHTNQTPSIIQQPQQTEAAPLPQQTTEQAPQQPAAQPVTANPEWTQFLQKLTQVNDPLLCSILNQSTFVSQDMTNKTITIQLSAESAFFKNKIEETKNLWLPILSNCFTDCHGITYAPRPQNIVLQQPTLNQSKPAPIAAQTTKPVLPSRPVAKESEWLMIKNAAQWPRASLILRYFPGKIKKESISRTP